MARPSPTRWDLFVDESGDFEDGSDDVAVSGLLVRQAVAAAVGRRNRRRLERAAPWLPWPWHAAHHRIPAFHALASLAGGNDHPALGAGARAVLERRAAQLLDRAHAEAEIAPWAGPGHETWRTLDWELRRAAPDLHERLQREVQRVRAEITALLRDLAPGAAAAPDAAHFVAGESWKGAALDAVRPGTALADRYALVLAELLRRVARAVGRWTHPPHQVFVHVLTRSVRDPALGIEVPFHLRHLNALLGELAAGVTGDAARLLPGSAPRYSERLTDSALVLADFAVNRTRMLLVDPGAPLAVVERRVATAVPLEVRSGEPPRTHLAAVPVDGAGARPGAQPRTWAREQAREWDERHRGGT